MRRVRGALIVGKEVFGGGRLWMRRENVGISGRLLIVGGFRKSLDAAGECGDY